MSFEFHEEKKFREMKRITNTVVIFRVCTLWFFTPPPVWNETSTLQVSNHLSQFSYFDETTPPPITTKSKVSVWLLLPPVVVWEVLHGTLWTVQWDNSARHLWEYPPYESLSNFLVTLPLKFKKLRSNRNLNYYFLQLLKSFLKKKETKAK